MSPLTVPLVTRDYGYWRQAGSTKDRRYLAGSDQGAVAAVAVVVDVLVAVPFVSLAGGAVDRLCFEVTTGGTAGSVGRAGIYANLSDAVLEPGALVVDGGEFDCTTTGVKDATIAAALTPGSLYWFVLLTGVAAPTCRWVNVVAKALLGYPATLGSGGGGVRWTVAQAYGALPDPFTTGGAAVSGSVVPVLGVRFA